MCLEEYGEAHRSLRNDWSDWCMFGLEDQRWEERNSNVQILKELSVQDRWKLWRRGKELLAGGNCSKGTGSPSSLGKRSPMLRDAAEETAETKSENQEIRLDFEAHHLSINSPEFYRWSLDHQEGRVSEWGLWIQKELDSGLAMGKGTAHSRPHSHPCKRTMREQFDPLTLTPWGSNKMMYIKCHWVSTRSLVRYQYMLASGNIKYASFYLAYSNWFR